MAEPSPKPQSTESSTNPKAEAPNSKPNAKPRAEFRHPVLQMMGISRLRIPSRNWMIFWAVTGAIVGGYWYDRSERRKIRQAWKDKVADLANKPMGALELPRKVKVYMGPPPQDYLDTTERHFKRHIKPYLTAAAIDYEVVSEDQQGHIRAEVAEKIRNARRAAEGLPTTGYIPDDLDEKIESKVTRDPTGGIICVGRGAYKEYMAGLQEGWMGPLEEPPKITEKKRERAEAELKKEQEEAEKKAEAEAKGENVDSQQDDEQPKPKVKKAEMCWLTAEEYDSATPDPRFYASKQDPIAVMTNPHLMGFLRTPQRFVRFFNQRKVAEECAEQTYAVIMQQVRPFNALTDADLGIQDEEDWPHKWKQRGEDNNSEWMRPFKVDDRIAAHLEVYDPKVARDSSGN